ncbi:MAG: S9 family peptidase [Calditrichaeota bacterium]|nr:MAG: S9 family peptidase [Calditrichota bacterium]
MKRTFCVLGLSISLLLGNARAFAQVQRVEKGNLVLENIPEIPQQIVERTRQYQNIRSASLQDWLGNSDAILISTRFGQTNQIHLVKKPGGERQQVTFFDEPVAGANMNPARPGFIFRKDVGGSEFYQLFYFDLETGRTTLLTDGKSRNGGGVWSHKGDRFAFTSTRRNGRDYDIYIAPFAHPEQARSVSQKPGFWYIADWSPDDTQLLVGNYVSINESYLYTLEVASGALTQVNPSAEKIGYGGASWSKDGRGIYYTSDEKSEFKLLRYYDLASGKSRVLTGDIPWDVSSFDLSANGRLLAFVTNEDGISKLHVRDLARNRDVSLPAIPLGQIYGLAFSPDSEKLGMVLNTPKTPGDVYVLNVGQRKLVRWTFSEVGGLVTDDFVMPQLIHYPTFDAVNGEPRLIPAFYYKPKHRDGRPVPVLVSIHGGPEGQYRPFFNSAIQYYVNELGIAVLAPNVRGSAGYGKSYLKLDNGYNREGSVKDIGALLDWIAQQPELDANRVAVMGGSYGGYMALATMTHFNDRLRAGIDIVGISNFVTFLENTKAYRRDLRRVEYGDERDPKMRAFLNKISPNNNADKITKPMFIAQGLNDPRVPATESEQMVAVIRKNGGQVWYMLAKDEGHGFRKKRNRDFYQNAVVLFLQTFLLGEETSMR